MPMMIAFHYFADCLRPSDSLATGQDYHAARKGDDTAVYQAPRMILSRRSL